MGIISKQEQYWVRGLKSPQEDLPHGDFALGEGDTSYAELLQSAESIANGEDS